MATKTEITQINKLIETLEKKYEKNKLSSTYSLIVQLENIRRELLLIK